MSDNDIEVSIKLIKPAGMKGNEGVFEDDLVHVGIKGCALLLLLFFFFRQDYMSFIHENDLPDEKILVAWNKCLIENVV